MPHYTPPLRDMHFVLHELLNVTDALRALPAHANVDVDTFNAVLEEGGKFASEVIAPLNQRGDAEGCTLNRDTHEVSTPGGFKAAYEKFVEGGWPSLGCDAAYGGQGLPVTLNQCLYEMLNSASQAWTMYPGLTHGAYECLHAHGTPEQRQTYLPKLTSGEWTGTMCLTEAHCGTDLGLLRTKAEPQADGSFLITGNKIFISAGEHDLAANIIHLVLARLPDAPDGSKGISLFVVPKFLVNADGSLGARNTISCGALEHKMGIHGNATCQMNLDGARGWLVGQPHKGLSAMFVMMNAARLGVGVQSLGLTEVAYQNAVAYAKDRLQSRALSGAKAPDKPADPIIVHPDVRKMLLTARAYAEGGRALAVFTALLIDQETSSTDEEVKQHAADLVALLTPIVKAFLTDNAWVSTSQCLQVFGGHGYVREWGMEQLVRDTRIAQIYEGANGIQALDLVGRKLVSNQGAFINTYLAEVRALVAATAGDPVLAGFSAATAAATEQIESAKDWILSVARSQPNEISGASVDFLHAFGLLCYAHMWLLMAQAASKQSSEFHADKLVVAKFFYARLLPELGARVAALKAGSDMMMSLDASSF